MGERGAVKRRVLAVATAAVLKRMIDTIAVGVRIIWASFTGFVLAVACCERPRKNAVIVVVTVWFGTTWTRACIGIRMAKSIAVKIDA